MLSPQEENEYIKAFSMMRYIWDGRRSKWTVKINSLDNTVGGVEVISYGFKSFRDAADKAIALFRYNLRNNIGIGEVTKIVIDESKSDGYELYSDTEDEWPEIIT